MKTYDRARMHRALDAVMDRVKVRDARHSVGDVLDWNGLQVRLVESIALPKGQSWRVTCIGPKSARDYGKTFSIPIYMLDRLSTAETSL